MRSCGPKTATCLPLRVRSSAIILAPASARPNAQYDWASSRRAGKLHDAADSDVRAATVCSMRETVSANRPRPSSTVPTRTLAIPHARYWPAEVIRTMSADRFAAVSKSPLSTSARTSPNAVR